MKKGNLVNVTITASDSEGRGICRIGNFAVFVDESVIGDELLIELTKLNKTYGFGKIINILTPSPHRKAPNCPSFKACGACQLMHIDYDFQLSMKRQVVKDALSKIGGFSNIEVEKTIGMEKPFFYRNKSQFPVCAKKDGFAIGFYQKNSHIAINMESCDVSSPIAMQIANAIRIFMQTHHLKAYNETTHTGLVRHVFVRNTTDENEVMVVLVINGKSLPQSEELVKLLTERFPQIVSIYQNINTKKTNLIMGYENRLLYGKAYLSDTILGKTFHISPVSFYQINHEQTEKLYAKAISLAQISKNDTVFDLYCGIGTITLCLADYAKQVIGVEYVPEAIENAKENAKLNHIDNVSFYAGAAEEIVPKLAKESVKADIVVLDPPRKGAEASLLQTILDMKPKRIVYVSCNPATLARDCKILAESGEYEIKAVQPFDMFCQTSHVETVVLMERQHNHM